MTINTPKVTLQKPGQKMIPYKQWTVGQNKNMNGTYKNNSEGNVLRL